MISNTGIWSPEEAKPENYPHSELLCFKLIFNVFTKKLPLIDFGCGDGYYLRHFDRAGYYDLLGVEGAPICRKVLYDTFSVLIDIADLTKPYAGWFRSQSIEATTRTQVLCLEVGEHIPKEYEQIFIDNLCNNCGSRMVISWAVEGQEGIGHVNCRNNSYVIQEIERRGFKLQGDQTNYLRADIEAGVSYFRNTLLVFDRILPFQYEKNISMAIRTV